MTEEEKRDRGLWYDAAYDQALHDECIMAKDLCFEFNQMRPSDGERRAELLDQLLGSIGEFSQVLSPFQVDYGCNVSIGEGTFLNHGAYLMDGARISIGDHCFIGPGLQAYTALHPLVAEQRLRGIERAEPICIESDVWIGGNVTILPGVIIRSGSVIGAGSVVTKNIPAGVIAAGNPCRVLRPITAKDAISD
ncbi:putative acetyltransferase [Coriobacterium glomerans PW2]|uniref:Acetyltransferase n=1 Tax=Coriobacterium glomerans (strain ATCC 49209 / DSM 20642 / JCM 10262 / PW2) TaxID=700015 RepID=F2NAG5_CORGP|nr:sugar O-acetyltransferase [Coriobacterium glomerans]AEB06492.1 putative acetyltransferase [Coriobacterium glomerans PW2]